MKEELNLYDELMIRVLDGYATEAEERQLTNWLQESPANQKNFEAFQKIWAGASEVNTIKDLDIEADLKAVKSLGQPTQQPATSNQQPATFISLPFLRKIAAVLLPLAVVGIALFVYLNQNVRNEPILLSDGTKVWLYKESKLSYPEKFTTQDRLVKLTGEAFFEVAKDTTKPFIIETVDAEIRVLGTSFNVQSEPRKTNVIVNTGTVQLSAKEAPEQKVVLTKGEVGSYQNAILTEKRNTNKNYRAWQNGVFEFDGTLSIEEVIAQLSKYYGRINLNTRANSECLLEAYFEKEELSTVLETINNACGY